MVKFKFENVGKLPPPVLQFTDVTFGYSPDKVRTPAGCWLVHGALSQWHRW